MSLEVGAADRDQVVRTRLRALAHPLRLRILSLLTGAAMTAADVARELGITHANASYHMRQLAAAGELEALGEEHIRGGVAKRYRYPVNREKPTSPDGPVLPEQSMVFAAAAEELRRRAGLMRNRQGNHFTDAELWVEPEVWADLRKRINEISHELHVAAKPPRTGGTIRVNATLALFEMEPDK